MDAYFTGVLVPTVHPVTIVAGAGVVPPNCSVRKFKATCEYKAPSTIANPLGATKSSRK